jgi:hypothetical protein
VPGIRWLVGELPVFRDQFAEFGAPNGAVFRPETDSIHHPIGRNRVSKGVEHAGNHRPMAASIEEIAAVFLHIEANTVSTLSTNH